MSSFAPASRSSSRHLDFWARRDRRRGGAQRPRGGAHPGPCRQDGPGLRGGADDRWRHADAGADTPRVPPRRLLHDPAADRWPRRSSGPSTGTPTASSSSTPTRPSPTPWTAAARRCWSGRSRRPPPAWTATGGPTTAARGCACSGRSPVTRGSCPGSCSGPVIHVPRHPLALARFGLPALRSAEGLARSRFRGEAARALFGGPGGSLDGRARPAADRRRSGWCSACTPTPSAGR